MEQTEYKPAAEGGAVNITQFDLKVFYAAAALMGANGKTEYTTDDVVAVMGCEKSFETRLKVGESLRKMDAAGLLSLFKAGEEEPDKPETWETWAGDADTMMKPAEKRPVTLRCKTANGKVKEYKAIETVEPEADEPAFPYHEETPEPVPREIRSYRLTNMAECLDELEQFGDDEETRDEIIRKFRAWTGIPRGGALAPVSHKPADELEGAVMWLYDKIGEFQNSLLYCCCEQDKSTRALYDEMSIARKEVQHKIGFFDIEF